MRVNSCDLQLVNPCIYIYIYSFIDVIHVLAKNAKGLKLKETMSVIKSDSSCKDRNLPNLQLLKTLI